MRTRRATTKTVLPDGPNPEGLCLCGCGEETTVAEYVYVGDTVYHDAHRLYVRGHHRVGATTPNAVRGEAHPRWKGGRTIDGNGYVAIFVDLDHPFFAMAQKTGASYRIPEHRLVMARYLNRPLASHEQVHHIDGDRENNTIENLQLRITPHGAGQAYVCLDCGSDRIAPTQLAEGGDATTCL